MAVSQVDTDTRFPGHLEWRASASGGTATALVDGLLGAGTADALPVAARDRHLAGLYIELYGPRVEAIRRCAACDKRYDIDFDLRAMLDSLSAHDRPAAVAVAETRADGWVRLNTGHLLRAPTGADERAVAGMDPEAAAEALLARCCDETDADGPLDRATAEAVLDWLAPILDVDLNGCCPECGQEETLRFCVETFLTRCLAQERDRLLRETHLMASGYHWSFDAILALDRRDRRRLAEMIEDDRFAARAGGW